MVPEEPPITELRFSGRNGTARLDGTNLYVFTDDARKAFVVDPGTRTLKPGADAIALLTTNGSNHLKDDRALLIEHVATGIRVGDTGFFTGQPLKDFYSVVIYPKVGLLPKPAATEKGHAAFEPGKIATLADAMKAFGKPTHREKIAANKWVLANGLGIEGEIRWWGEYGVRADAKGEITHILLRNPFGKPAEKRPALADVVKEWTPALAGAETMRTGGELQDAQGKNLLPPRVATHFLELTGVTFEDLWNDYATKCGSKDRFKATTFLGAKWQGDEGKPSYLITDRETRIGERVTGFTCRMPGHTVAITIQPKGDGKTILCTLVVVLDE